MHHLTLPSPPFSETEPLHLVVVGDGNGNTPTVAAHSPPFSETDPLNLVVVGDRNENDTTVAAQSPPFS